jgi:hypothetical protein
MRGAQSGTTLVGYITRAGSLVPAFLLQDPTGLTTVESFAAYDDPWQLAYPDAKSPTRFGAHRPRERTHPRIQESSVIATSNDSPCQITAIRFVDSGGEGEKKELPEHSSSD